MLDDWEQRWGGFLDRLDEYKRSLAHRALQGILYSDGTQGVRKAKSKVKESELWRDPEFRRLIDWRCSHLIDYRHQVKEAEKRSAHLKGSKR